MEIYIAKNKIQMGPYEIGQVTQMLQTGILKKYDLYWHEGMLDWGPVGALKMPPPPPPQLNLSNVQQPSVKARGSSGNTIPGNNMGLVAGAILLNSYRNEQIHQELHKLNHTIHESQESGGDMDASAFGDF